MIRRAKTAWRYRWVRGQWVLQARMFWLFNLPDDKRPPMYLP